jgi:hypothetical protein
LHPFIPISITQMLDPFPPPDPFPWVSDDGAASYTIDTNLPKLEKRENKGREKHEAISRRYGLCLHPSLPPQSIIDPLPRPNCFTPAVIRFPTRISSFHPLAGPREATKTFNVGSSTKEQPFRQNTYPHVRGSIISLNSQNANQLVSHGAWLRLRTQFVQNNVALSSRCIRSLGNERSSKRCILSFPVCGSQRQSVDIGSVIGDSYIT